ncbi:Diphthamide biosynthesis protein 4 [Mortierella polycephala]|uniref:Diphthamide biosynthesis protein 4 n=1 Tax=Mortierella polycephala TaxID=41804 RepID=A0A9P6TVP8_9FUNG|nr:Diphthamide biosynthesis protein 4 [Mortierella polycephala]
MLKDYYAILSITQDATVAEIKQQYQKLLLIHHPDKQQQNQFQQLSSAMAPAALIPLQDIKEAWECLRQPDQRTFYDSSLKAMRLRANGQVNDDIDLDDMEYDEGKSHGEYIISEDELELGVDTVVCSTCSLIVRIHYEVADDDDDDDAEN